MDPKARFFSMIRAIAAAGLMVGTLANVVTPAFASACDVHSCASDRVSQSSSIRITPVTDRWGARRVHFDFVTPRGSTRLGHHPDGYTYGEIEDARDEILRQRSTARVVVVGATLSMALEVLGAVLTAETVVGPLVAKAKLGASVALAGAGALQWKIANQQLHTISQDVIMDREVITSLSIERFRDLLQVILLRIPRED